MSKRTQQQQRERARASKEKDRLAARKKRSQVVVIVMVFLLVLSLVAAALAGLVGNGGGDDPSAEELEAELQELMEQAQEEAGPPDDLEACPPAPDDVPEAEELTYDDVPALRLAEDAEVTVTLVTTCGDIVLDLRPGDAPVAVGNFVALAEDGYFDGTPFHRTQWDFVIQGGDPAGDGTGGPGYELPDELELAETFDPDPAGQGAVTYPRGTLAMANRGPDTAGSQFFIVQSDPGYPFPPLYTVFGQVAEGMDVVDRIAAGDEEGSIATEPIVVLEVLVEGLPDDPEVDDPDADDPPGDGEADEATEDEGADDDGDEGDG